MQKGYKISDLNDSMYNAESSSSFDVLEEPLPKPAGRRFIVQENSPDKFTKVRKRIELFPSRCTVFGCNFDIAIKNGFADGWPSVPERERRLMIDSLQEHIKIAHNKSEDHIIDEADLPKKWLGHERGLKDI